MRHFQHNSWLVVSLVALGCAADPAGSETDSTDASSTATVTTPTQSASATSPTSTASATTSGMTTSTAPPSTATSSGTASPTTTAPATTTVPSTEPTGGATTPAASSSDDGHGTTPTASSSIPGDDSAPETSSSVPPEPPASSSEQGAGGDTGTDPSTPPASSEPDGAGGTGEAPESPGCATGSVSAGDETLTIDVGGESRQYVLHVPAAYDGSKPVPLILDFHGLGGSGPNERSSSPYPAQTDGEGVIMAFATGKSGPSGSAWNVGPCCVANVDDVEFAKALVAKIEETACIDTKRVYAVGFSMGGGMSHYLACHAADVFAAVAPAAFDLLEENVSDCAPARPITVVSFRGTGDPIVPYEGGYSAVVSGMPITFLGAEVTFAKWAEINGCTGSPSAEDGNGCSTYSECQDGTEVVLCTKQGGSHEAGNASVGWPILKRHTMP